MSERSDNIEAIIGSLRGKDLDPHYLGFFHCFNREQFFEAHEVLEALWLQERGRPKALFYKGLIQLAGAFVHIQKNRPRPAIALLRLAEANLQSYPAICDRLDLGHVRVLIAEWMTRLGSGGILPSSIPKLELLN